MRKPFVGAAGAFACVSPDEFAVTTMIQYAGRFAVLHFCEGSMK
jgi:hypothetical protein